MGTEIERRFRVNLERLSPNAEDGKHLPQGHYIKQGYLNAEDPSIRIRLTAYDNQPIPSGSIGFASAVLTVKGKGTIERPEFNVVVTAKDAVGMMALAKHGVIEKVRYNLTVGTTKWELDQFLGFHEGLWLAEVELPTREAPFARPPWLGEEVTEDRRFNNAALASNDVRFYDPLPPTRLDPAEVRPT